LAAEIARLEMLKITYGEYTVSKSSVLKLFGEGREYANNEERQDAPIMKRTDKNVTKIRELV
jgi:hypothetical protein